MGKVRAFENPADILTKPAGGLQTTDVFDRMGFRIISGQSALSYTATAA